MPSQLSEDEIDDLLYYARTGELEDFSKLTEELRNGESYNLSDVLAVAKDPYSGNGPVHMAAANGHTKILDTIIKALTGSAPQNATQLATLNAQNTAGNTALHWAALNGHLECVKMLIDSGADPTITNAAGHDAVFEAELNDKKEVVDWVLKEGQGLEEGIGGSAGVGDEVAENMEVEESLEGEGSGGAAAAEEVVAIGINNLEMKDKTNKS